jgi:hypothetical protein
MRRGKGTNKYPIFNLALMVPSADKDCASVGAADGDRRGLLRVGEGDGRDRGHVARLASNGECVAPPEIAERIFTPAAEGKGMEKKVRKHHLSKVDCIQQSAKDGRARSDTTRCER